MEVLSTLYSILLKLHGVPTIRIMWDICLTAAVKAVGGFVINFFYYGKWEWYVFQALLVVALLVFFIREALVIIKKELGLDIRKTARTFAENRRSRTVSQTQSSGTEEAINQDQSASMAETIITDETTFSKGDSEIVIG